MKRIFLVDDHPLVCEWLAQLIQQQPDLGVCGQADTAPAALSAIAATLPDLVIIDLNLHNSSGLDLISVLREHHAQVPVLVLSMHDESLYAERAFAAGARGYLNKRETAPKVIDAIRRVLAGKIYINDRAAESMALRTIQRQVIGRSAIASLSNRELEVFQRLGQGLGTRQIAEEFHVSIKTIQEYCSRIKEKLHLNNATELLREAVRWYDAQQASGSGSVSGTT